MKINFANARTKALLETAKELGRIFLFATLPVLADSLEAGNVSWRGIMILGIVAVLRGIDKYTHVYGEETKNDTLSLGLSRF